MERSRQPGVFVAMPFGHKRVRKTHIDGLHETDEKEITIDFDEIYENLIRPALEDAGCKPYRADEETTAGDIRTDMNWLPASSYWQIFRPLTPMCFMSSVSGMAFLRAA